MDQHIVTPNSRQVPPNDATERRSAMSVQSEPSRTRGLLPSPADTDARNNHMGSRLLIAHIVQMMSTVLFVYTRPVKTDSKNKYRSA